MTHVHWNRRIWLFAGPVILSNVSVPLLGAVDTAVVGQLPGPQYMGAVAVGALVFSVLYSGMFFLRMGTTGLTAQSHGAGDGSSVRAWLIRALAVSLALGAALVVLERPIRWAALALISPTDEVGALAREYYNIRIWGAPAALANFALLGWFFGVQDTRSALVTQIVMNGANIALDLVFVNGLGWGVAGVGWATLMSEVGALFLGLALARRRLRKAIGSSERLASSNEVDVWDRPALARMFAVNRDIFLRSMCLQAAFAAFTAISARMGDDILAANAVLMNFQMFMAYGLDGFANAAESFVGEAVGARSATRLRSAVMASSMWALLLSLGFTVVYALFGADIINVLTHVSEVRSISRQYLVWAVVLPMLSVWSFQLDGIFVGATRAATMRNGMALSLVIFGLALTIALPLAHNHGLWASYAVFMIARAVTLGCCYPALERSVA